MVAELGHFALILALFIALAQAIVPLWGAHKGDVVMMNTARPGALGLFLLVALAFGCLTYAYITSDFSVANVYQNSHTDKPMLYKISGVWGNHEGSLLLWITILSLFGLAVALAGGNIPPQLRARALSVQAMITVGFLLFILLTSNPFLRLDPVPLNGKGLNPLLQDPGLAFHPPMLYLGYVGFSMAFSFAIAALIEGRVDAAWARWVRPWTLAAWTFLTLGIGLGSWWAYYELGWGGWWFWDPVENASFMPWLVGTALLHSAIVVEKRDAMKSWTILLAILAFAMSLLGTFLVRSGVITSVHAFASDPTRGVFILMILAFFMGGALMLYVARAGVMQAKGVFGLASRETALVMNNILLAVSALVVFVGTIWPLLAEMAFARKLSVGAPFFDAAFTPFMVILALILPVGALLPWKRAKIGRALVQLRAAFVLALALAGLVWTMQTGRALLGPVGVFLGVWLISGSVVDLLGRSGRGAISDRLRRMARLPRADWGKSIAHAGLGVTIFGIAALTAWQQEDIRVTQVGERFEVGAFGIVLDNVERVQGPNYLATRGTMSVWKGDRKLYELFPEKRVYPVAGMPTTEAAIHNGILRDMYLVIGDPQDNGGWAVRTYVKPFANWIWTGALIMAFGGVMSLSDRRYRVAAGARKTAAAPGAVPAE